MYVTQCEDEGLWSLVGGERGRRRGGGESKKEKDRKRVWHRKTCNWYFFTRKPSVHVEFQFVRFLEKTRE